MFPRGVRERRESVGPKDSGATDFVLYTKDGERLGPIRDLPEVTVTKGEKAASAIRRVMDVNAELKMSIFAEMGCHFSPVSM